MEGGWRLALASASIACSTKLSQLSSSPPLFHLGCHRWLSLSRKNWLRADSSGGSVSVKPDNLTLLQIVSTSAGKSPRNFLRKSLNSTHDKEATPVTCRLCWCQQKLVLLQRNEAAKVVQLGPVAQAVSKWSSHFSERSQGPCWSGPCWSGPKRLA